jgi:hypothetical protein
MTAELSDWAGIWSFNFWKGQEVICSSPLPGLDPTYFLSSRYEWLLPVVKVMSVDLDTHLFLSIKVLNM